MDTEPPRQVLVYGAGGFAREVAWLIESCGAERPVAVAGFIDDEPALHGVHLNGIEVMGLGAARERFPTARVVGGVGDPRTRERLMDRAAAAGFAFATVVHPRTERSSTVEIGDGTVVCAGNILTTNIRLGRHVQINLSCTVGHDVVMGDFATLAPGVHLSGWVQVGARAYLGTGATVINGTRAAPLVIGDDAVVGAGACVTRSVAAGTLVVGVPARPRDGGAAGPGAG